ncbi:hypothetical protein D3C76_1774130 [compost metagenome]
MFVSQIKGTFVLCVQKERAGDSEVQRRPGIPARKGMLLEQRPLSAARTRNLQPEQLGITGVRE